MNLLKIAGIEQFLNVGEGASIPDAFAEVFIFDPDEVSGKPLETLREMLCQSFYDASHNISDKKLLRNIDVGEGIRGSVEADGTCRSFYKFPINLSSGDISDINPNLALLYAVDRFAKALQDDYPGIRDNIFIKAPEKWDDDDPLKEKAEHYVQQNLGSFGLKSQRLFNSFTP